MVLGKISDAFDKLERKPPARTVDVFRTFASLSPDAATTDFNGMVRVVRNSFSSNAAGAFSYPEMVVFGRSFGAKSTSLGWLWFAGTITVDSEKREVFFPLLSMPVDAASLYFVANSLVVHKSPRLFDLVEHRRTRDELLSRLTTELGWDDIALTRAGRLTNPSKWVDLDVLRPWIDDYAHACGFEVSEVRFDDPKDHVLKEGVSVHIGTCLVDDGMRYRSSSAFDLTNLQRLESVRGTAFNALYGAEIDLETKVGLEEEEDADHLADVLAGSGTTQIAGVSVESVAENRARARELLSIRPLSHRQRDVANRLIGARLGALSGAPGTGKTHIISVVAADAISRGQSVLVVAGSPHAVDAMVEHFLETPGPPPIVFGGSKYGARVGEELDRISRLIDKKTKLSPDQAAVAEAHDARAQAIRDALTEMSGESAELDESAGARGSRPSIDELLTELVDRENDAASIAGTMLTNLWIDRLNRQSKKTLHTVGEIARQSPKERRKQFASLNPNYLTKVLPLWVGSVDDVDNVLPTYMQMFDLVIIDEAAQIDQVRAANSLVRARRALICGDPAQIGIDNAPTDEVLRAAKEKHGTTDNDFDVQNRSVFDVAASMVPVEFLDEHFRSVPHLIEFSSRRFYDGALFTATRKPANEAADHIDLVVVHGARDADGVNHQEVEACLDALDKYINAGHRNLGVVSPFRVQAEAIDRAVQSRYSPYSLDYKNISDLDILVGTVNQLQGHERDQMVISLCVGTDEPDHQWEPVNDQRFFNVMVTRARHHATVLTSSPNPPGLAGEYIRWTEPLVDLVRDAEVTDPWVLRVAEALRAERIPVRLGYRVGRYVLDLVAGEAHQAVAIECTLHPDGVDAHIDRGLMLRRTGWRTADAFENRWGYLLDDYPAFLREKFPDL